MSDKHDKMKADSEFLAMKKRHSEEEKELKERCPHQKKSIIVREDGSGIGRGSSSPSVEVICTNCGLTRVIRDAIREERRKVRKTMEFQGFGRHEFLSTTSHTHLDNFLRYP